jgi:hypothetical protein
MKTDFYVLKISKLNVLRDTLRASKDFGGVIGRLNQSVFTFRSTLIPIVFVKTSIINMFICAKNAQIETYSILGKSTLPT